MFNDASLKKTICAFASANGFPDADPEKLTLLALGGSDRRFYRVASGGKTCIAMVSPPPGDEQLAWHAINTFLQGCSINVPHIFACDEETHMMLVEDVGDTSLYRALNAEQDRTSVLDFYRQALVLLAEMQVRATPKMRSCASLRDRRFGYDAFRHETDYFARSFLREYCHITPPPELEPEFHHLAQTLAAEPVVFMHRDFQSQNIHISNSRLTILDFQTATAGPPHYDLASLLKDAYFVLSETERDMLLQFYVEERARLGLPIGDPTEFTQKFHLCGLQRNMQALAAFAFLGTHKGKKHFYAHIPAAFNYLAEALHTTIDYPYLQALICSKQLQVG